MILNGALINGAAVLAGGLAGSALKKGIPERLDRTLTQGLGLCVVFVGISGALKGEQVIIAILSMVIGTLFGELINIDRQLTLSSVQTHPRFLGQHLCGELRQLYDLRLRGSHGDRRLPPERTVRQS